MKSFSLLCIFLAIVNFAYGLKIANFGQQCSEAVRCNLNAAVLCRNHTCHCRNEEQMTYDSARKKCVVLAGKLCGYKVTDLTDYFFGGDPYSATEKVECVPDAYCNDAKHCECEASFFATEEGLCAPQSKYLGKCSKDAECDTYLNFICVDGQCSCNSTEAVYDKFRRQCVGKVGTRDKKYLYCTKYADRVADGCKCRSDYAESKDGICLGWHGETCAAGDCYDEFICVNGECACPFPTSQLFEYQRCISRVNGPCLEKEENKTTKLLCGTNAECRNDTGVPECLCKPGFIKSKNGECRAIYGSKCNYDFYCDQVPRSMLICKEGICSCGDFQEYDFQSSKCVGLHGAVCGDIECVKDAYCELDRDQNIVGRGICRCKHGMISDSTRNCVNSSST